MPDKKITALDAITTVAPANDLFPIVDVSDNSMAASGTTKNITVNQLLGAGGTATLASATITGDLTVRTNQLVVNSSGSFVGKSAGAVGVDGVQLIASGFSGFSASATTALFVNRNTSDGTVLQLGRSGASAADLGAIAGGGLTVGLGGSDWMRINSTGLGVGASPSFNIHARGTTDGRIQVEGASGYGMVFIQASSGNSAQLQLNSSGGSGRRYVVASNSSGQFLIGDETAVVTRLTIDSSGNVGVGGNPAAAVANNRKVEIVGTINSAVVLSSNSANASARNWAVACNWNTYGDLAFLQSNALGGDPIASGAGTTRMTLDASGRLLVGKTSGVNNIETVGAGVDGRGSVGVSTVATTIYTIKQSSTAAMCVVFGDDGSNGFCDIVLFLATVAPKVVSSQTLYGSPAARTYTASTTNLQLAIASGTLTIRTAALSTLNS